MVLISPLLAPASLIVARTGFPCPPDLGKDAAALERDFVSAFRLYMTSGAFRRQLDKLGVDGFHLASATLVTFAARRGFAPPFFILGYLRRRARLTHMVGLVRASPSDIIHAKIAAGRGNFTYVNSAGDSP
jgi:hypothetical protein